MHLTLFDSELHVALSSDIKPGAMPQPSMFLPLLAIVLSVLAGHATANAISAFFSKDLPAPQVMMYEKGKIYHSLCNSQDTPVFPYDDTAILSLKQKPIENTDIAITAGKDGVVSLRYCDYHTLPRY